LNNDFGCGLKSMFAGVKPWAIAKIFTGPSPEKIISKNLIDAQYTSASSSVDTITIAIAAQAMFTTSTLRMRSPG